ncbi:Uncharacterised protein [Raoultella terrigena]|nr:Uncharacterised protein [Raoultella terrigena]
MANSEIYQDMHVFFRNLAEMQIKFKPGRYLQTVNSTINAHRGLRAGKH